LSPFVSYKENDVLRILLLIFVVIRLTHHNTV
jgi:hypothetical protein